MMRVGLILLGLLAVVFIALYFSPEHQRYLAFDAQRTAWHARCDRYIGIPTDQLDDAGTVCLADFQALMATAIRNGWQ